MSHYLIFLFISFNLKALKAKFYCRSSSPTMLRRNRYFRAFTLAFATIGTFTACGLAAYQTTTGKETPEQFQVLFDKFPISFDSIAPKDKETK